MPQLTTKQAIARCFNKAAPQYDAYSNLQQTVGYRLFRFMPMIESPETILDLGGGSGYHARVLQKEFNESHIFVLDIAESMLNQAYSGLSLVCADFDCLPFPSNSIDVVFSNMALHWSSDWKKTLSEINRVLVPGGLFAFSIPIMGTLKELHEAYQLLRWPVNVNSFVSYSGINRLFYQLDYIGLDSHVEELVCEFSTFYDLLKHLKTVGGNFVFERARSSLVGRQYFVDLAKQYSRFLTKHRSYPLTYKILYGLKLK